MTPDEPNSSLIVAQPSRELQDALAAIDRALRAAPERAQLHVDRARILQALGRHEEALAAIGRSVDMEPGNPAARFNLGCAFAQLGRFGEALAHFDAVEASLPEHGLIALARARSLRALARSEAALAAYDRAVGLGVVAADVLLERGAVLLALERLDDALASFEYAARLDPGSALAANGRAHVLQRLHRFAEALAVCDAALTEHAGDAGLLAKRGAALHCLLRFEEAHAAYELALAAAPDDPRARYNSGLLRMLRGDFAMGLPLLEARWGNPEYEAYRYAQVPPWRPGMPIEGRRLLVWSEQGYGDSLQFVRYVPALRARGAQVLLEVSPPLKDLFVLSFGGCAEVHARGEGLPGFDLQLPLMSLPLLFGTRPENVPAEVPYLQADPARVAAWEARLGARTGPPRVGVCVSGNAANANDRQRSIPLALLRPLYGRAPLFLLQKDLRAGDEAELARSPVVDLRPHLDDFADTAAALTQLDLLVSVDTSVAHLAGALARPVWMLLAPLPDWRWGLIGEASAWYPTARLFRRASGEDWAAVIECVARALEAWAA